MIRDTFYVNKVLQETKTPIRYLSKITWVSMPTLKAIKSWAKRHIQEKQYNMFIEWYKKHMERNLEAREKLLEFNNK